MNSETISEPFVIVTHRRRSIKERRQDNNSLTHSIRFPSSSSSNTNNKRFISLISQNSTPHSIVRNNLSNNKSISSSIKKHEIKGSIPSESVHSSFLPSEEVSTSSSTNTNSNHEQPLEKQQLSPHLSSHSSSSSLSSLLKRQSKPPPVVFLNKSIDIELNDVSFGFDLDSTTLSKALDDNNNNNNNQPSPPPTTTTTELHIDTTDPSTISIGRNYAIK